MAAAMISVIIPVYNAGMTLEKCLNSILAQTCKDYEVILIDDGSWDQSGQICDHYAKMDGRFQVIHTKNRGVSCARNTGLLRATGTYVMFVDSDDHIVPDYLETYIAYMERTQADAAIGGLSFREGKEVIRRSISLEGKAQQDIWEDMCIHPQMYGYIAGKCYRRRILQNIRFCEHMYAQEDLEFNLSVYEQCNCLAIMEYAGYEYVYVPGKRRPPVWDFLANILKMYRIASQKGSLSAEAEEAVYSRIRDQLFACLYDCDSDLFHDQTVQKVREVQGLTAYLRSRKHKGEKGMIISWFLAEKYRRIYRYFRIRKGLKKRMGRQASE